MSAGKVVGAITRAEAISLIDEAHFAAFGMTNLVVPLVVFFTGTAFSTTKKCGFKKYYQIASDIKKPVNPLVMGFTGFLRGLLNPNMVLATGLEPVTPCMSCKYSNQLS